MSAKLIEAKSPFTIRTDWRGGWLDFEMPADTDMILVCVDTVQHVPVWIGMPHQLRVDTAMRLMDKHGASSLHVMPYRDADKIQIGRAALEQDGS
jgi:hypothetical protein